MISKHIALDRWISYFTGNCSDPDRAILYAHVCGCTECRNIFEYGKQLRRTLSGLQGAFGTGRTAYQAVASAGGAAAEKQQTGSLTVQFHSVFLPDTITAEGCANKYALNPELDGRILQDDSDLLTLELCEASMQITFQDKLRAFVRIASASASGLWHPVDQTARIPLPAGANGTVEFLFIG